MQSQEQLFAAKIFDQVTKYPGNLPEDSADRKQYGSMAHKLPILVRQAGLVQALAFVQSRKKDPYIRLLEHIADCLEMNDVDTLMARSRNADLAEYIYLTNRVMLALKWYKRFAQSILKVEPTEDGGEHDGN